MIKLVAIACGGALGSLCRYGLSLGSEKITNWSLPLGTFLANMLGCFLIGIFWGYFDRIPISNEFRLFLFTGFLGGFTTFSTFARESAQLFKANEPLQATAYLLASNIIGVLVVLVGLYCAHKIGR